MKKIRVKNPSLVKFQTEMSRQNCGKVKLGDGTEMHPLNSEWRLGEDLFANKDDGLYDGLGSARHRPEPNFCSKRH
jgi:hypothetical protein